MTCQLRIYRSRRAIIISNARSPARPATKNSNISIPWNLFFILQSLWPRKNSQSASGRESALTTHYPNCSTALPTPPSRTPLFPLRAAHPSPTTSSRLPLSLAHGSSNVSFLCPMAGKPTGSLSSSSVSPSLSLTGL